jgi:hypothetical protein
VTSNQNQFIEKHIHLNQNEWIIYMFDLMKWKNGSGNKGLLKNKPMVGERSSKLSEVNLRSSVLLPTPESPIMRSLNK